MTQSLDLVLKMRSLRPSSVN